MQFIGVSTLLLFNYIYIFQSSKYNIIFIQNKIFEKYHFYKPSKETKKMDPKKRRKRKRTKHPPLWFRR